MMAVVWKLRKIHDDFHIKTDLAFNVLCGSPIIIAMFLPDELFFHDITFMSMNVMSNAIIFGTITWKVILSFQSGSRRRHKRRHKGNRASISTASVELRLQQVLDNPVARDLFTGMSRV